MSTVEIAPVTNRTVGVLEAAQILGISRALFYVLLAREKSFPRGCKLGRRRVWLVSDLFGFLEKRSQQNGGREK
jgi:predicted DNA-binding transcriptional regulator AlpA